VSLAATLREALDPGRRSAPVLLEGDPRDPLLDEDQTITPAAVLMAVVDRPDPTVILTLRPDTLRQHPGQIAFPGGRIDPGDDGPVDAALREAEEEIGLFRRDVEIVGTADCYRTITGFEVTPVVGIVPPGLALTPHPGEVAAIFEAPLDYLLHPEHQVVRTVEWQGRERVYYEILWQDRRIWGATAAMIVNLSRRLAQTS
jgi:8-oxo-dGTP pyrophosphatase MutT (NUDIX family)